MSAHWMATNQTRLGRLMMHKAAWRITKEAAAAMKSLRRCDSNASAKTPPMKVRRNGRDQSQGVDLHSRRDEHDQNEEADEGSGVTEIA